MNAVAPSPSDRRSLRARRVVLVALVGLLVALAATREAPALTFASAAAAAPMLDEPAQVQAMTAAPLAEVAAPRTIDELRGRIAEVLAREEVPGVGLAIVDKTGVRWAGGVGLADVATGAAVTADTQFRVASITKSFVALGVMRLVEQRRLALDRPLREIMPEVELANAWEAGSPVTLAHALEHTTGFDEMRFNEWYADEGTPLVEALARNPRSRAARWRPGSRMSYANPGYTLAGHAIELATGESYETYLEREVLGPLGMPTARFRRTPEFADRLATGYRAPGVPAPFRSIVHTPAGALLASPRELGELVHFWLLRGARGDAAIVGPASLARIETTGTLPYRLADDNYGLGNYGDVAHPVRSRGHDGGLPGFLSCYRYFPELGVGYVMLLNGTYSPRAYREVRELLFAHLAAGRDLPRPPRGEPDPGAIAASAGYYGYANPRVELFGFLERATTGLSVRASSRGVVLEGLTGSAIELVPTDDGGYRHRSQSGTSVRLTVGDDGRRILVGGMAYFEAGSRAWAQTRLYALGLAVLLIQLAPWWALARGLYAGVRRVWGRRPARGELALHAWPAAAGVMWAASLLLLTELAEREAFVAANAWTVGFCACTLLFAACSAAAVAEAVRAAVSRSLPMIVRVVPSAAAAACFGMTLYLLAHGIIGLRLWAW